MLFISQVSLVQSKFVWNTGVGCLALNNLNLSKKKQFDGDPVLGGVSFGSEWSKGNLLVDFDLFLAHSVKNRDTVRISQSASVISLLVGRSLKLNDDVVLKFYGGYSLGILV